MRSRLGLLTLAGYLTFTVLACTSKPPANDAATSTTTTDSNGSPASNDGSSASPSNSSPASRGDSRGGNMAANREAAAPQSIVVPSGTVLTVRLGETLSSKQSQAGQSFSATLAEPVQVDGQTLIPSGATASGTVVAAQSAGKFKGASLLQIKLNSITVGWQTAVDRDLLGRALGKGKREALCCNDWRRCRSRRPHRSLGWWRQRRGHRCAGRRRCRHGWRQPIPATAT